MKPIQIFILIFTLVTSFAMCIKLATAQEPHECGKGPQTIDVVYEVPCETPDPPPELQPDGSYRRPLIYGANAIHCTDTRKFTEMWTDWPECGGERYEYGEELNCASHWYKGENYLTCVKDPDKLQSAIRSLVRALDEASIQSEKEETK